MKFPTATVILVSAALAFVIWDQTREQPAPVTADRFTNLAAQPAERGTAVDWAVTQVPRLCEEATGVAGNSDEYTRCLDASEVREPTCRRAVADHFPGMVASEKVFRDLSITMMDCLIQQSRPLGG